MAYGVNELLSEASGEMRRGERRKRGIGWMRRGKEGEVDGEARWGRPMGCGRQFGWGETSEEQLERRFWGKIKVEANRTEGRGQIFVNKNII